MPITTVHRQYSERACQWERCRHAFEGEDAVKAQKDKYLPKLGGQSDQDYTAYLLRSMWYGATDRTIKGLTGAVMRVEPKAEGPESLMTHLQDVTLTGQSLDAFSKCLVQEVLTTGRAGLLLDMSEVPQPGAVARPYWCWYAAEQIVNWRVQSRNGLPTLTLVVLKEEEERPDGEDVFESDAECQYRVLKLGEGGNYTVEIWTQDPTKTKVEFTLTSTIVPLVKGQPIKYIPFVFVNALTLEAYPEKPPLLDLVNVNFSHYRSSADIEHGRHYTALPTPWITGATKETSLKIGSQTAWAIVNPEARVGMLEFTGQGLGALETALETKEKQMAVLGARMLEEQKAAAEASETLRIRNSGDQATLGGISKTCSAALTRLAKYHAEWIGAKTELDEVAIKLNTDFFGGQMSAQELTSLMQSWQSGGISYETYYYNLERGGVTRPGVDAETERLLVEAQTPELSLDGEPPDDTGPPDDTPGGDNEGGESEEEKMKQRTPMSATR